MPLQAATAVVVLASMGRPVLFRQRRPGQDGAEFTLYKFRTMRTDPGLPDADRLTTVGRFLRSTSLDELPSLWNVLKGDMSLVGPRPLLVEYLPRYTAEQARRHEVQPGLTGLAQVSGRNLLLWEDQFALDVEYVDTWSLRPGREDPLAHVRPRAAPGRHLRARREATRARFTGSARMIPDLVVVGAAGFGRETLDVVAAMNDAAACLEPARGRRRPPVTANLERLAARGVRHLGTLDDALTHARPAAVRDRDRRPGRAGDRLSPAARPPAGSRRRWCTRPRPSGR